MEKFNCKTEIIAGAGASGALKDFGIRRLFLVSDPFFYENGTAGRIAAGTGAEEVKIFHRVEPDPTVALAAAGTAEAEEFGPDWILALGGGSAMDCAKAIRYFLPGEARLAAIPTTSGSGAEVTDFAILTHNGVKHPLVDSRLRPEAAILDSDLLEKLPGSLVAAGGFDLLSHALEAYVAKNAGAVTDALAAEAFRVAYGALPASFGGTVRVRPAIHMAATMAGMAFSQAGLGLCHALSHSLGGAFHIPHGTLNAILLPAVIGVNAYQAGARYARIARLAGLGGSADTLAVRNLKNALIRLRRELALPDTLAQAGIAPQAVWRKAGELVKAALADPCCGTNPIPVEDFMVRRILEEVTGRV